MYSSQHEVTTHWGHFLLDDAAYAAYLEGKLWINWGAAPQKNPSPPPKPFIPMNVSPEAVRLRDLAAHQDVYSFLQQHFPGRSVPVPYRSRMADLSIEEMNLSVRSSNALLRANARTFGRVAEIFQMQDGLRKIRNLGTKSEKEIIRSFYTSCYHHLTQAEQAMYWQELITHRIRE